jgi:hypothetical protein
LPAGRQLGHPDACETIRAWAAERKLDAVIWTALGPRFKDGPPGVPFTPAAALNYLDSLPAATKAKATEYVLKAPEAVITPFRSLFGSRTPTFPPNSI